jgi:hypothetical protein
MDTLNSVLNHLKQQKQDNEFIVDDNGMMLLMGRLYRRHEVTLVKTYRFEGDSDPAEEAILYLVGAKDGTVGYSIDTYGTYTGHLNDNYADFIQQLPATVH